jgi:hypothetical protein
MATEPIGQRLLMLIDNCGSHHSLFSEPPLFPKRSRTAFENFSMSVLTSPISGMHFWPRRWHHHRLDGDVIICHLSQNGTTNGIRVFVKALTTVLERAAFVVYRLTRHRCSFAIDTRSSRPCRAGSSVQCTRSVQYMVCLYC